MNIRRDISERKEAEETLRESHRRTEEILESITDAFWAVDREWRFTYVNDRALATMRAMKDDDGLTREDVLDKDAWELFPEVADTVFDRKYREALRTQEPLSFEEFLPPDGPWFEVHLYPSEESLSAYYRDITERKRAEEELRESSRRTENILESITDEFVAFDREWRYTYINERALKATRRAKGEELTRGELLGKSIWEVFPELVGSVFHEKHHEVVREQKPVEFEAYSPLTDRWIELHLYTSEEGLSVYYQNITERKQAEEGLETRTREQAVVAELGIRALAHEDPQGLMDDAVTLVARTLDLDHSKIVELLPGGHELLMRAAVGWEEGFVGTATEAAGYDSEAGYTLRSEGPVIAEDLSTEKRFRSSDLVLDEGMVSVSVIVHGAEMPFGVLSAHATVRRSFSEDNVNFLQAVANVLAIAIEREEAQQRLEEVREAERSRIARDLHDDAIQDLSGLLPTRSCLAGWSPMTRTRLGGRSGCSGRWIG